MAKPIPIHDYENLLDSVAQYPLGAGIDQIEAKLVAAPTSSVMRVLVTPTFERAGKIGPFFYNLVF